MFRSGHNRSKANLKAMKAMKAMKAATLVGAVGAVAMSGLAVAGDAVLPEERGAALSFVYTVAGRNTEVTVYAPAVVERQGDEATRLDLTFRTTRPDGTVVHGSGDATIAGIRPTNNAEIVHLPWGWFVVPTGGEAFLMATRGVSRTGEPTFDLLIGGQSTHPARLGTISASGSPELTDQMIGLVAEIFLEDGSEGENECAPTLGECMETAITACGDYGIDTFSWSCENPPHASCSFSGHAPVPE